MINDYEHLSKVELVQKLLNIQAITEKEYDVDTKAEEQHLMLNEIADELAPGLSVLNLCRIIARLEDTGLNRTILSKVYTVFITNRADELNKILDDNFTKYYESDRK